MNAPARLLAGLMLAFVAIPAHAAELADARALLLTGKYAEAINAYQKLAETEPVAAALGIAEAHASTGQRAKALETLGAAIEKHADNADLRVARAQLAFDAGDLGAAESDVAAALKANVDHPHARWLQAELWRTKGELKKADEAYSWFVDYYNRTDFKDADELRWVGRGVAQHARWQRHSALFGDLVNELYPSALKLDKSYWPAHHEAAHIWLEKFNKPEATKELKAALALNPNAADVYVALARLALQTYDLDAATSALDEAVRINPELAAAHYLRADVRFANFDIEGAINGLVKDALPLNPKSDETLGRLAAAYVFRDGKAGNPGQAAQKILAEVNARNAHAGSFYLVLGETLENLRKFSWSERYLKEAAVRLPQLIGPQASLGMLHLRLGDEKSGREELEKAFEADPFHVRVSNTLKVLDVLDAYETLETEHFIIRYDQRDKLLAKYAGRFLESVYPELCKQFGYEPPEKSLFELFSKAKNTSGHGWFSARMVGLPHLGTVGACAGKMVALASPTDMPQPYHWARVLKHEFVHVINLQQTDFNLPHWFAEGLAVLNENYPRSPEWNALLAARFAEDTLFTLDDINFGFIRPQSSGDWTLAYCQAELYVEYMLKTYGDDALAKLLAAFADNLNTRQAIERAFGVSQENFDKDYRRHVADVVKALGTGEADAKLSPAELEKALAADPKNADLNARAGLLRLDAKQYPQARRYAETALAADPQHQLGGYILARLHLLTGETGKCLAQLEACLDRDSPDPNVLALLGGLYYRAERYEDAAEQYELGAEHQPGSVKWLKYLARVYLQMDAEPKLRRVLTQLAELDADDLTVRKKLAEMALKEKDFASAERWSLDSLHIDVLDAESHHLYAQSLESLARPAEAAEEADTAVELSPETPAYRLTAVRSHLAASQLEAAASRLAELEKLSPDDPAVKALRAKLDAARTNPQP